MPTNQPERLLARLNAIASSLANTGNALALIGLGSAGLETNRLDNYSDLDFFAVVEEGRKHEFLDNLAWLSSICPIAFAYRNTRDGHKVLFEDGVFCEFAVFELPELRQIPFSPGRVVWKIAHLPDDLLAPEQHRYVPADSTIEWLLGEALTNLYTGLSRHRRGETLSAVRCIQVHAVDRSLELAARLEPEQSSARDPFAFDRRFEQRYPGIAQALPEFIQGYARNVESAQAILGFLDAHFPVDATMKRLIQTLCDNGQMKRSLLTLKND